MNYKLKPWDHQLRTIKHADVVRDLAILHDCGTGKCGTAINILRHKYQRYQKLCRTLILAPSSVCRKWVKEFNLHADVADKFLTVLEGTGREKYKMMREIVAMKPSQIVITNYDSLDNDDLATILQLWKPEILICDESQLCKNPDSKRAKKVMIMADGAAHRYILSGTPMLNSALDYWMQFRILDKGETFGRNTRQDFFKFRKKYFIDKNEKWKANNRFPNWVQRPEMVAQLNDIIASKSSRAVKSECLDLPPLIKKELYVKMGPKQAQYYNEMRRDFLVYLDELKASGEPKAVIANQAITKSIRLQQIVSGFVKTDEGEEIILDNVPRLDELKRLLEDLTVKNKVIVWACFKANYKMIKTICKKIGVKTVQLHGGVSIPDRDKALNDFEHDDETRVMVANQAAGGLGVDMIAASYAIYYTRTYKYGDDAQSQERNYRGGSEIHEKITRIDLVTPGTIDENILGALKNKKEIAELILDWKL